MSYRAVNLLKKPINLYQKKIDELYNSNKLTELEIILNELINSKYIYNEHYFKFDYTIHILYRGKSSKF